jgi:malonate transporter
MTLDCIDQASYLSAMSALAIVVPIFVLVFAGWLARRLDLIKAQGMVELNRFVVWLALPALLFDITAHARLSEIWQPGFIAAFGASVVAVFGLTVLLRMRRQRLADAVLDGLGAAYGNVAFIGFPVLATVMGAPGLMAATIATLITVCALFAVAVALIETGLQAEARLHHLALKVGRALLRNPLVVAPLLGGLAAIVGLAIPDPFEKALKMLGGTASPCALVTIGLFVGARTELSDKAAKGVAASTATLVALKLVLQPAIALALALALRLPASLTQAVVLLAAMPTGAGPFMLAEFYRREALVTSRTILVSTVASAATLSACIALTQPGSVEAGALVARWAKAAFV